MFEHTKLKAIMALTRDNIIGTESGNLPWKYKEDMQFFRESTFNKVIIMGKSTYDSIGHLLPNRTTYILSKSMTPKDVTVKYESSKYDIATNLTELAYILDLNDVKEAMVVGGLSVYEQLVDYCDEFIISEVPDMYCILDFKSTDKYIYANNLINKILSKTNTVKTDNYDNGLTVRTFFKK